MVNVDLEGLDLDKINTGVSELDEDLKIFFQLIQQGEKVEEIKELISEKNISREEFFKEIPEAFLNLLQLFLEDRFEKNIFEFPEDQQKYLKRVEEIFDEYFHDFLEHPHTKQFIKKRQEDIQKNMEMKKVIDKSASKVEAVTGYINWEGTPPDLIPQKYVVLLGPDNEILFSSNFTITQMLFLAQQFTDNVLALIAQSKDLEDFQYIDTDELDGVKDRLADIKECINEISNLVESLSLS